MDDENDFLSQCLIRLIDLKSHYEHCRGDEWVRRVVDIPKTTEALCNMLKESIITLLRAYKDTSIDVEHLRIFPDNQSSAFDSSDDEIDIFNSPVSFHSLFTRGSLSLMCCLFL